jgi:rRNA-processing protein CGR1
MDADLSVCLPATEPIPPLPFLKNTSGRFWKQGHSATVRAQAGKSKDASSSAFAKRLITRKKDEGVKKLEK